MEKIGYLVGQTLKLSDELHAMYCQVKRDGDIPPQLVGNALFATALDRPDKALALLGQRLAPYLGWARQYGLTAGGNQEAGKEAWRAGWYLRLYSEFAGKLENVLQQSARLDEFERAQLLLGYLADFPKRQKENETDRANNKGEQDNEQ